MSASRGAFAERAPPRGADGGQEMYARAQGGCSLGAVRIRTPPGGLASRAGHAHHSHVTAPLQQHRESKRPASGRWRHLLTGPATGAWNMAVDDALLARARTTGETVLRVYTWSGPTLSLGRNQPAHGLYDLEQARLQGIEIIRRPTGGRAVLHHREITYSITAPTLGSGLRDSFNRINELLLDALNALGVNAEIVGAHGRSPRPDHAPCFEVATAGELTVSGRKLVGSAQWREDGALLQHGSILIDDDQQLIGTLSNGPPRPTRPLATLRELLGRVPEPAEVFSALRNAVVEREDEGASALPIDSALRDAATAREDHYHSPHWTWRL